MNALKEKLDVTERGRLRKLELVVAEGMSSFVAVGEALKEIRDSKLYREAYKTFDKYVSDKWSMQKSQAYRLIDASVANQNLSHNVGEKSRASEITNPRQLCELKNVPVESIEAVVDKAAEIAGYDKITASDLKQARQEVLGEVTATATEHQQDVWEDVDDEPETATKPEQDASPKASKPDSAVKEFMPVWDRASAIGKRAIWLWLCDHYEGAT
jgi:hypothetical protein